MQGDRENRACPLPLFADFTKVRALGWHGEAYHVVKLTISMIIFLAPIHSSAY